MNRKVYHLFSILILIYIGSSKVYAQKLFILNKTGKTPRIRYFENDIIALKTIDGAYYYGSITSIKDSSLIVNKDEINLSEIKYIQNTQKYEGWKTVEELAIKGGIGYFIIDSGNHLINGEAQKIGHPETLIISSVAVGIFIIAHSIANKKYRINKRHHLKIIDLTIN